MRVLTPATLILALLTLAGPLAAQTLGGGGYSGPGESLNGGVYRPPSRVPETNPGPGGSGGIPPDGGVPPGDPEPVPPDLSPTASSGAAATPTTQTGPQPAMNHVRGESSRTSDTPGVTLPPDDDRWEVWWAFNKFDFIRLHRVQDAPYTGQGQLEETPEQRERRLARVRATLRKEVIPALRSLTASPDPNVRAHAAQALGKLRDQDGIDVMRPMLSDNSLDVRYSTMLGLGIMESGMGSYMLLNIGDDTSAGRGLVGATGSLNRNYQGGALILAALRGDRTSETLVISHIRNRGGHPELLTMACEAAGLMRSSRAIRPLLDVAFDESLPQYVRSAAISALGRIGDPSVTPALVELLDSGLEPRRAAAVALGYTAHGAEVRVINRLGEVLRNESDAPTRHFAAITLGRIGGPAARARLLDAFQQPRRDMRPWLALALGICERSNPEGDIADLLMARIANESNANTLGGYLIALGLTSSEKGIATLTEYCRSRHVETAAHAAMALGLTGQPTAEATLREIIRTSGSPMLVRNAAFGLGILGDTSSIPDLVELIRTTNNPFVASFAALGISLMGDAEAVGSLLHVIERQGDRGVATTFAVAAVGQLFDTDRRPVLSNLAAGDNYLARIGPVNSLLDLGF